MLRPIGALLELADGFPAGFSFPFQPAFGRGEMVGSGARVDFIGRYNVNKWSAADCMKMLRRTLDVPVAVAKFDSNQMPVEARITLQEVG